MKKILVRLGLIFSVATLGVSCTTAYDSSGRAHKVVTPEGALLGAAAAGVVAYSLGKSSRKKRYHRSYGGQYGYGHHRDYRSNNYYGHGGGYGGYGYGGGCR